MKKLKLFSWCKQSIQFLVIQGGLICNREFDTSKTEKNITVVCIIRKKNKDIFHYVYRIFTLFRTSTQQN